MYEYLAFHLYFSNDVDRLRQAVFLEEFGRAQVTLEFVDAVVQRHHFR